MSETSDSTVATVTVDSSGLLSTIQDRGRFGLRHLGVPWSGTLVPAWQQLANTLVGNDPDCSVIESFEGGLRFTIGPQAVRMAVMASPDMKMEQQFEGQTTSIKPCRSYTLAPETTVTLSSSGSFRHVVVAFHGLQSRIHLGSASTYAKAGLGGQDGKALTAGARLHALPSPAGVDLACKDPLLEQYRGSILRVVLGPQQHHFSTSGIDTFLGSDYTLGAEVDRMGARLSGKTLEHRDIAARDIVSDAIVPGSIQVPGNGQPIVLLNDAHTAGGYPKIATVISIDLPLLGLQRTGNVFRFEAISADEAIDAVREQAGVMRQALTRISPIRDVTISTATLLSHNLIDGVTDGQIL